MAANITTFQNGVVAGDKIGEQWLNECHDKLVDTSTGHDHDGTDSKQIADIDISSGVATFNTSTGHDHDGTDSKLITIGSVQIDSMTTDSTEASGVLPVDDGRVLLKTYTFTPTSSNNILQAIKIIANTKISLASGDYALVLQITNDDTSEVCYPSVGTIVNGAPTSSIQVPYIYSTNTGSTTYVSFTATASIPGSTDNSTASSYSGDLGSYSSMALASSYTIKIYGETLNGATEGETVYIDEVQMSIIYADSINVNTASGKFS